MGIPFTMLEKNIYLLIYNGSDDNLYDGQLVLSCITTDDKCHMLFQVS